jgi:hypothetical protein
LSLSCRCLVVRAAPSCVLYNSRGTVTSARARALWLLSHASLPASWDSIWCSRRRRQLSSRPQPRRATVLFSVSSSCFSGNLQLKYHIGTYTWTYRLKKSPTTMHNATLCYHGYHWWNDRVDLNSTWFAPPGLVQACSGHRHLSGALCVYLCVSVCALVCV